MTQPPLPPADRPVEPDGDERQQPPASSDHPGYLPPGSQQPPHGQQQPYGQQQYGQQPYGWGAPAPAARPGITTTAAIVLIVLGVLTAILGLFFLLGASLIGSGTELPGVNLGVSAGAVAGILVVLGGVIVAFGILEVVSGINIFSAKGWARILAIVLSVIGGLFGVLALIPSRDPEMASGPIFGLIVLAAHAFVIWALATTGRYFTR